MNFGHDYSAAQRGEAHFSALADEVEATHDRVIVTETASPTSAHRGRRLRVVADDQEILSEPGAVVDIYQAEKDIAEGRRHSLDDLRRVLEDRRRGEHE